MSKIRRYLKSKGFTLIEILVVIVIIGVLSIMGVSKYTEFTTTSRVRGCCSNENSIDKAVGVWESQNVAIPQTGAVKHLQFGTDGKITATDFAGLAAPPTSQLTNGNLVIYQFTKDVQVFTCPERFNIAGGGAINQGAGIEPAQYDWRIMNAGIPALNGRTRGTLCVAFGTVGPDGTTATKHLP